MWTYPIWKSHSVKMAHPAPAAQDRRNKGTERKRERGKGRYSESTLRGKLQEWAILGQFYEDALKNSDS